ncbi:DUF2946 family protein [Oleiagrimonas sp. C23AA]|uniref:DUF2946 family protein n=1 Tax=Oleiagrimonas sp. C23AA TaxID=2719047 RepID=UPI0014225DEE|nr:DUF2946 family protein [Oleiagrimonas sp. C23AA]NII10854.1 hypothetical protein [Oleiagrimonas sp. C23AA]
MRRLPRNLRLIRGAAFLAMALLVCAPVVSRLLSPAQLPTAWCGQAPPPNHALGLDCCGYCSLLGHSPLSLQAAKLPVLRALAPPPWVTPRTLGQRQAARPLEPRARAPPRAA